MTHFTFDIKTEENESVDFISVYYNRNKKLFTLSIFDNAKCENLLHTTKDLTFEDLREFISKKPLLPIKTASMLNYIKKVSDGIIADWFDVSWSYEHGHLKRSFKPTNDNDYPHECHLRDKPIVGDFISIANYCDQKKQSVSWHCSKVIAVDYENNRYKMNYDERWYQFTGFNILFPTEGGENKPGSVIFDAIHV